MKSFLFALSLCVIIVLINGEDPPSTGSATTSATSQDTVAAPGTAPESSSATRPTRGAGTGQQNPSASSGQSSTGAFPGGMSGFIPPVVQRAIDSVGGIFENSPIPIPSLPQF